ncbi:cytochrome protein, partial [Elaphomyces granulatus]
MTNIAFTTNYIDVLRPLFRIEVALLIVVTFLLTNYASSKRRRPLPPGPRPLFLIKNLHQMPRLYPWRVFQEWHKMYGPIISLQFGQRVMISIGSYEVAHDLLEKRKDIYDTRPRLVVSGECISKGMHSALLPYGPQWKAHRRLISQFLSNRQTRSYRYLQDVESKQLLYDLLGSKDFVGEFSRFNLSIIMTLAYGKRVESRTNRETEMLTRIAHNIAAAVSQTASGLVEAFLILNRLPRWAAPWKRMGDEFFAITNDFFQENMRYDRVRHKFSDMKEAQGLPFAELSYILGVLLEASLETTTGVFEFFTVVSVLHPESVGKTQEELDSVVGPNRLPSFDDISNLPYVNAFIKEVLRWRPVGPMLALHASIKDDEYLGYHIPRGAIVIANQWAINLDDESFQDPYEFRPERWLQHPESDRVLCTFGLGRRSCPGKQLAQDSLFIAIARILWAYNIPHCHVNGKKVPIDSLDTTQSIVAGPSHFQASFSIRSPAHQQVV